MHRIGERSEHFEELCAMFQMKQLVVDGIFSHLCVSDGQNASDQAYTRAQAECFQQIVQHLEEKGYACGKNICWQVMGFFPIRNMHGIMPVWVLPCMEHSAMMRIRKRLERIIAGIFHESKSGFHAKSENG